MALLPRYDPPGLLADFDQIDGQRALWDRFMQDQVEAQVQALQADMIRQPGATALFYNPAKQDPGRVIPQAILWNAFPRELLRRFGRDEALVMADRLWPLPAYQMGWRYDPHRELPPPKALRALGVTYPRHLFYRPQNEYCEWHVERNKQDRLSRVTFTAEPPEYWQALAGSPVPHAGVAFPGNRNVLLQLYRSLVNQGVKCVDLLTKKAVDTGALSLSVGDYNPFNKWNTTHGIMHLSSPPNTLIAEIKLAAQATQRFQNRNGAIVVRPDVLMAASKLGGANRNSDTAIAATVNALARQGRMITLANPVGLYIDHIDLTGWQFPGKLTRQDCVHDVRGQGNAIQRLVVEMPMDSGYDLADICIGGVPLRHGGQIAECITVRLTALATLATFPVNAPLELRTAGYVHPKGGREIFVGARRGAPPGTVPAYVDELRPQGVADRSRSTLPRFVNQGQVR